MIVRLLFCALLMSSPCFAGDDTRDELRRIMSGPEYGRWRMDGEKAAAEGPSLLKRFVDWLGKRLDGKKAVRRDEPPVPYPNPGSLQTAGRAFTAMGYVLLGLAALFFLYVLYKIWRERAARPPPAAPTERTGMARALEEGDALAYAGDEWNAEAERLLDTGETRLAFRSLYLGLLSGLHAKGGIVFAPNRSNWQYVAGFRGDGREEFAALTDLFDRVWYGRMDLVTPEGLRALRTRTAALLGEGRADA